jgi:hypothetical protein
MVPAFMTPSSFLAGANPAGVVAGDINGDGKSDLAVVNQTLPGSVSVLISNGDGTFQPKVDYATGSNAMDIATGDFNGDGKLDLATVSPGMVNVLLNNGDGTLGVPVTYATGLNSHSMGVGDFNRDGKLDIVTMNYGSTSILLGNGDGTFQAHSDLVIPGNSTNTIVADFNNDGILDLATSNTVSIGTVTILRGHGDGTFDPAASYYAFSAPVYLGVGDFNHDGFLDLACPNSYAATSMSVMLNNGDGTYAAPHTYGIAQTGYEIEVADFNNDGNQDFAVRGSSEYMVSLGKGDGTFYPSVTYGTTSGRFQAGTHGDFNGDGATDLAYPGLAGVTVVMNDNNNAAALAGAVGFRVSAPATTTSGSMLPMSISAIDANGNIVTNFAGTIYISSSDPAASTTAGYAFTPTDAGIPYTFTAADAGTHAFSGAIKLVTQGDQTVTVAAPSMTSALVHVNVTGQVSRFAVSAPTASNAGDTFNVTVSAIDVLGNVGVGYSSTIHFASNDVLAGLPADYTFTPADAGVHTFSVTLKSAGPRFLSATEVGGTATGGVTVNVAPLAAVDLMLAGGAGAIGVSRPISIAARDIYGNVDPTYAGTVHIIASINVTFLTVGTQTITATDVINPSITGTVSSDATPSVAKLFAITGYPATTAGVSNTFTVSVVDTIGQTAMGYTGTIYFSSSDVQAGLPASYTFTAADAGVHTFAMSFRTAGLQQITATDLSGLTGSEMGIPVSPAPFVGYRISVPLGTDSHGHYLITADDVIPLTVRAIDTFGNAVANYGGTVNFSSTDALATLPASYTFTPLDAGVHTFNFGLHTATAISQVWSISVTDASNAATIATLTNFEVVNGVAASFGITTPTQITAGVSFSSKVTVSDAYGNGVKNYFGTVHFSTSAALAGLPANYTFNGSDAGVHTFDITLDNSGNQTLTVTDAGNPLLTSSAGATVKAAAVSSVVASFPATTVAGVAQPLTVTALDAFGNVSDGYTGTVTFRSSDAQAGLPANYTFSNKDAGVHVFNVMLKTAGAQSISVTDTANATLTASQSGITVTPSATAGSFIVTGFPATTAGAAQSFTVAVKDAFGNLTTNYTGTVTFSSSDVQAGLPASYTFTAADAGVHSFTATLKTAGTQSITVKDASNATAIGSQTGISVSAASTVASIAVAGFPATTAGAAKTFTVTARDAFGNVCTNYMGTVNFSSSDAQAGLPASYTFTATDAGVHTFTATLKTAGTQSITVKDAIDGTLLGTQAGISVTAAAAARFSISAPTSVTQGVGFKFTVTVLDAYGNVCTGYRGKVHLSSTDAKSGTSDYTFSSKDNGVATFSYTFNTLGLQTLSITDTTNSSVTSSATVNVVPK